jgi:hypothetical protein
MNMSVINILSLMRQHIKRKLELSEVTPIYKEGEINSLKKAKYSPKPLQNFLKNNHVLYWV